MNKNEKQNESEQRFQNFLQAMVAKFGEGNVITAKEAAAIYDGAKGTPNEYAKWRDFAKNQDYKLGRNQFVVTTSKEPSKVRDVAKQNMEKLQKAKEGQMLPKATRKSAEKLVKAMGDMPKVKATRKARKVDTSKAEETFDNMMPTGDSDDINDINNILRVHNN